MIAPWFFRFRTIFAGLLCGVGLLGSAGIAQAAGWVSLSTPSSVQMFGMDCGSSSACVAVGVDGALMKTSDYKTWSAVASGVTADLVNVDFYATTGFAVGMDGVILKTTDGGTTWTSIPGVTIENIFGVSVVSSSIAYVAAQDGHVYKTTDGGTAWTDVGSSLGGIDAYTIDTYSSTVVYVAGKGGRAYKSTDGGATWTSLTTGTTESIYAIDVVAVNTAFIAGGNGFVAKTTNGSSFTAQTLSGFGSTEAVTDLACTTTSLCLLSGSEGTVNITGNGGTTWTEEAMPGTAVLGGAANVAVGRRFVVGNGALFALDNYGPGAVGSLALSAGGTTTTDTTPEFTWTDATDNESSVASYEIAIDGSSSWTDVGDGNMYAFTSALSSAVHTVTVRAVDAAGNAGTETTLSFTVTEAAADTTAPTVGAPSPTTGTVGLAATLTASYADAVGVSSCTLYFGSDALAMTLSSGTASYSNIFDVSGTYTVYVTCVDAAGNTGTSSTVSFVVSPSSSVADTTAPTVSTVTPTTATQNTAVTFTVTATDAGGMYACYLMVDGASQGEMTASGSTYSRSYTSATSGTITAYAWCGDAAGNVGTGASTSITVAAAAVTATDATAPTVGAVAPDEATAGETTTLSASVADSGGMGSCVLYVNSAYIGSMTISGGYATRSYTFTDEGNAIANAYCVDAAGNATRGASTTLTIAAAEEEETEEQQIAGEAEAGSLIKLACGGSADAEDPCHAVYYYDSKRHAFPNEKVFLTWYENFDDVVIVTEEFMSSVVLGINVTYHPGTRMVKFVTQNTVYGVGEAGELRAIMSEDVAESIWGTDWNTQIDDISDAFYSNYRFGEDIERTSDFDPDTVESSVRDIVEILNLEG
jgi:photosystem II stability/assembly factor-like uncharacterized protein